MRTATHPGEVLGELYLKEIAITQQEFAKHLGVSFRTINEVINKKRNISIDMAFRLSKALDTTPEFWVNLQRNYDISKVDKRIFEGITSLLPA